MKIRSIIAVLLALLLTSCASFGGYSPTLEDARKSDLARKHHAKYDFLYTAEEDIGAADFIISGDSLVIIKYNRSSYGYKAVSTVKFNIPALLQSSAESSTDFLSTGILPGSAFAVKFILAYTEPTQAFDGYKSFEFTHNGTGCTLFYKIIE